MTNEVLWIIIIVLVIVLVLNRSNLHIPMNDNVKVISSELSLEGDCGHNLIIALHANNSALQKVILKPGDVFSFNETMGDPEGLDFLMCADVYGGNLCNLAALYSQASRDIGLNPQFVDHGIDLGAGRENSVTIWNISGVSGFNDGAFDLVIENTLDRTVTFIVVQEGNYIHIEVQ